jgi:hypothetical protein
MTAGITATRRGERFTATSVRRGAHAFADAFYVGELATPKLGCVYPLRRTSCVEIRAKRRRPSVPASSLPRTLLADQPSPKRLAVIASARASSGNGSFPGASDGTISHAGSQQAAGLPRR